jgi:hypothetical protein
VLRFSGDKGAALNEIVGIVNAGEVAAILVPAGPEPPLLEAKTENVYDVDGDRPGTVHETPGYATVHVNEPGLDVTV